MTQWWRAYGEAVDDPKLQRLPGDLFKAWFNVMCLASSNGGVLPEMADVAFKLRLTPAKAEKVLDALNALKLLDIRTDGRLEPHNWNGRQYKTDVSTERVKRFRKRQRNVPETPPETDTDTETDTEKITSLRSVGRSQATRPNPTEEKFEEFWKAYPKRAGANPKAPARKAFFSFVKSGVDPAAIIAGARRCAEKDRDKIGTEYIPQSIKWLRDRRWEDYGEPCATTLNGRPAYMEAPPGMPSYEEEIQRLRNGSA